MNRVYRLVYNRTLGVWQVASELVKATKGGLNSGAGLSMATLRPMSFALWLSMGWVGLVQPLSAQQAPVQHAGRIVSDPSAPANQRPTVVTSANGTPQVNITTPSAKGVSRNSYRQFDVGSEGAILNNSRTNVQTELGGWVQGNPYLATGTARVILNEVNSADPSQLRGYVEVAGDRAQVVIANPAGIQVDGGGFLNASRVTLTTGTPIVNGGSLDGYRVDGGAIRISGAGLDASRTDYTDIITRSLDVNAGIWANQLQASLGSNVVSADHSSVTAQQSSGQAPAFALDVGALGGMYANKIWLVGNEHGLGVRNAGNIGAQAGELVVTVDGRLENSGALQSQQDTKLSATGGIANSGTVSAAREAIINTAADLDNSGGTLNGRRLEVNAGSLRNREGAIEQTGAQALDVKATSLSNRDGGRIGAVELAGSGGNNGGTGGTGGNGGTGTPGGGNSGGTEGGGTGGTGGGTPPVTAPLAAGALNIGDALNNDAGRIDALGTVTLATLGGLDNSGGKIGVDSLQVSGGELRNVDGTLKVLGDARVQGASVDNSKGQWSVSGAFDLAAHSLLNRGGIIEQVSNQAAHWSVAGQLDNSAGTIASNAKSLTLEAGSLVNEDGTISHAGDQGLSLTTGQLDGQRGTIATAGALTLTAGTVDHRNATLNATQLTVNAAGFDNRGGTVVATGQQANTIQVQGTLDNGQGGTIASNGDLSLKAATLGNAGGTVQHAGTGNLRIDATTLNGQGGTLLGNGTLTLTGQTTDLSNGTTSAQRININTGDLTTAGGQLSATSTDTLSLQVRNRLDNTGGTIGSNGAVDLTAAHFINDQGKLIAAGTDASSVRVTQQLDNRSGTLSSNGDVRLQTGQLNNAGGTVVAADKATLQVTVDGLLDNSNGGRLTAGGDLSLSADTLDNQGGAVEHAGEGELQIAVNTLHGRGGTIVGNGMLDLQGEDIDLQGGTTRAKQVAITAGTLTTADGTLASTGEQALQLQVRDALNNDRGTIAANGALEVAAGSLSNRDGTLSSAGTADTQINVAGQLDNSAGTIASNAKSLTLEAGSLVNEDGTISHAGDQGLALTTGQLDGQRGTIATAGALTLSAGTVDHRNATLNASQLIVNAAGFDNRGGTVVATGQQGNRIQVQGTLDNGQGGTIASNGDLSLKAATLGNAGGIVQHAGTGNLRIDATTLNGQGGTLLGNGTLTLTGQTTDLSNGTTSAQRINITTGDLTTAGGQLSATSTDTLSLQVRNRLDNTGGTIGSNGAVDLTAAHFINDQGKLIAAGTGASNLHVTQQLDNRGGTLSSNGDVRLQAGQLNNAGGTVVAADKATLQVTVDGLLDNSNGGRLTAGGDLSLSADTLDNQGGAVEHAGEGELQIAVNTLHGKGGTIVGNGTLDLQGEDIDLQGGTTRAKQVAITAGTLTTADGTLASTGEQALQLQVRDALNNDRGTIAANGALEVAAGSLSNRDGTLSSAGTADTQINVAGQLDNSDGTIASNAKSLTLEAGSLVNEDGTISHAGDQGLTLTTGQLDGQRGTIATAGALMLTAGTVDHRNATLNASQLTVNAAGFDNRGGTAVATGQQANTIQVQGTLDNGQGGTIASNGDLSLKAATLGNAGGIVQHAGTGNLRIDATTLNSQGGTLLGNGTLTLTGQTTDLSNGTTSAQRININTGDLTTAGGQLSATSTDTLSLQVRNRLDNTGGTIGSNGAVDLTAANFINNQGTLQTAGAGNNHLTIAGVLENRSGSILTAGNATVEAASFDNRGGTLHAAGASRLVLDVDGLLDNRAEGVVSSGGDAVVTAQSLDNRDGTVATGGALTLTTVGAINNEAGLVQAGKALSLSSQGLNNAAGTVLGASVDVDTRGTALDNRSGTLASLGGALTIRSGALDNTGGLVQSAAALNINTAGNALTNRDSGSAGGIVSAGTLEISSGDLDNRAGVVFAQGNAQLGTGTINNTQGGSLVSASDLNLRATSLANSGGEVKSGRNADINLQGALDNNAGLIAATGTLVLQAATVDNRNTAANSTLGIQAGDLQLKAQRLDNQQGQVIADGSARLELTGQLNNTAGQVSTGADLSVRADDVVNTQGTLVSGGDLQLDARHLSGDGKVLSQGDATLNLVDGFTNVDQVAANGKLTLNTQGALDNQGKLQGGSLEVHANRINNASNGEISSAGLTHLIADGAIVNRGLLDGVINHIQARELDNVGSGRIYGDHVAIQAGNLLNRAESVAGITTAATIAARERLDLGVGTLSNTGQSLIFSDGNAAIGGALDADRIAVGTAAKIDNISSTIEVSGDLDIASLVVNNIRENVVVTQSTTVKAPVRMNQPGWFNNGSNSNSDIRNSSNYRAYEIYYLSADDILEDESYVTPDGYMIRKAVIRVTPQTSAYFFGRGSLYGAKGERSRLVMGDDTMTIYYSGRQDNQVNPDQVAGGADDPFLELRQMQPGSPAFSYISDTLAYSSAYGTCTTNCVQLTALYQYNDPEHILTEMRRHPQNLSGNEQYRIATQTVVEDVLVSAGADAVIHAGGNMRIRTDTLLNQYASISADRNLAVVGINQSTSSVNNVGYTLYRTHSFKNVSYAYNGSSSAWSNPDISERAGQIGGLITAGGTLTVDVGDLSNLNNGRDAPNVQDGALVANLNTQGPAGGNVGPGAGQVQGPGQANGQGASGASVQGPGAAGGAGAGSDVVGGKLQNLTGRGADVASVAGPGAAQNNGQGNDIAVDGASALGSTTAVKAAGDNPGVVVTTTVNNKAPNASLFKVDANGGQYLVETDPRFANYRNWLSSDHLLAQMGFDPANTQKRLGDGFYEQKLVREQIGELTGRRFLDGYASDEDQYRALLEAGATVAKGWGLRPGIALTAEQMAQLTSDIVWLVEQTITLADGSTTTALVPQVYLRVQPGDLDRNGALLAGANVDIKLQGDLVNQGDIAGRQLVSIDAGNIRNLSGANISGQQVGLQARQDIDIIGSTVTATDAMSVKAGGNITVASTTQSWDTGGSYQQRTTSIDRVAGLYVTNPSGQGALSVNAGGDINLTAAQVVNAGVGGTTALAAGGNLNLGTITEMRNVDVVTDSRNHYSTSQTTQVGSTVSGAGNVVLQAGNDVNLAAANVNAGKAIAVQAGRDINSVAATDTATLDHSQAGKRWSKTVSASEETVQGTQLTAGGNIAMQAGRDITLQAATVTSDEGGIGLLAGRDVNLTTAQEHHEQVVDEQRKKKGTFSSKTTTTHDATSASYAVGTVLGGSAVQIAAGNDVVVTGSTVLADGDVRIAAGNNVTIESAQDTFSEEHTYKQKKSGISASFSGGVASVGYGKSKNNNESASQATQQVASAVGSLDGDVLVTAGNKLTVSASDIAAGNNLTLAAKDIQLLARQDTEDSQSSQSSKSSGFSVGVTYDPGKAYRSARDSTTDGMADSGSTMGKITRTAEGVASGLRAATTSTVITAGSQRSNSNQNQSTSDARVSQLSAGGDLTLMANGGSIYSQGAQMAAEGDALLLATKDIVFDVAYNTERSGSDSRGKGWGIANNTSGLPFGTNNSRSEGSGSSDTITGTQLSVGGGVRMATSEGDISLTAANIVAEKDVNIHAAGDLTVRSGQDTVSNANTSQSKAIGTVQVSDTEKFSGWHRQEHEDDSGQVSQVASNIGSLGGNVNLSAGGTYSQIASNVVADKDINITAAQIELLTADEVGHSSQSDDDLKIGVFARVKSPFIDLINNVDAARQSDGRLQQMQGMAAAANAYQAASAVASAAGAGGSGLLFSAEAGVGFKSANSSADSSSVVSQGSTLQAGGNLNLTSTSGDIHVVQGNLSAGNTLSLDSARDILLEAGQAQLQDKSKSSNAGAEVGVGVQVGAQTGVYVYAEASVGSSKSNSTSTTWQNTTLTGQNISLKADGDTTLRGATATADRIDVKTGGTLTIESLQDVAESMSKNSQVGGRVQVSIGNAWNASGYASAGKSNGSYQGVGQQSGLFAGEGGYHVEAGHVNLIGGAIASTNAGNSELTAQTLTFSDLQNEMDHKTSSGSISGGFSGGMSGKIPVMQGATPSFGGGPPMIEKGGDSSTTHATLTEGNIVIGGKQTTAAELGVNTDAAAAHRAIDALPNAEQLLADQQAMAAAMDTVVATSKQIADDIGNQAMRNLENDYLAGLSDEEKERFNAQSPADKYTELQANRGTAFKAAEDQIKNWGIGSENGRALEAVTTLLVGVMSGQGGGQVAANALAPYAAQLIGDKFDENHGSDPNAAAQLLSHALLGALLAEVNGGNAGGGAAAAAGGELAAKLLTETLYPGYIGELDDQQKQTILALSQAVGAVAGSATGDGLAGSALATGIAKNAVENNYLDHTQRQEKDSQKAACNGDRACREKVEDYWEEISLVQSREMKDRYVEYLTDDERDYLFNLKPGTPEYDSILAHGVLRVAASESSALKPVLRYNFQLLTETDWVGPTLGPSLGGLTLESRNRLEMAILGPIFGAPGAYTQILGGTPEQVAGANRASAIAFDLAGMSHVLGPRKFSSGNSGKDGESGEKYFNRSSDGVDLIAAGRLEKNPNAINVGGAAPSQDIYRVDTSLGFHETGSGTHLRRVTEVNGQGIQINSGHSYNRVHNTGDIRDSGFSMNQVDSAIARDIASISNIGGLPKVPKYDDRTIDMGGYKITYRATMLPSGVVSVTTYFPGK